MARPEELHLDEKWDKAVDITLRRAVYGSIVGVASGLLFFREFFPHGLYGTLRASPPHSLAIRSVSANHVRF